MASLYSLALALRWVPLLFSPLPFNIDGFPLAKITEQINDSGNWRLDPSDPNSYNLKMPVFSFIWSAASQLASLNPLVDLQWFLPILTATVVVPTYLLGVKATANRIAGFAAGLFIAIFGSFLFLTSAIMRESIGLLVLPAMLLLFHERADPRKRALASLLLLILPFLHHLTALIALGSVTSMVVLTQRRALARGTLSRRLLTLDVASGPLTAVVAWVYYDAVDMPFFREVTSGEGIVLFLAIVVLVTAGLVRMWRPMRVRIGRSLVTPSSRVLLVPVIALGALLVNVRTSLFAGTVRTQATFLTMIPAILFLAVLALLGFQLVRRTSNRTNDLVVSMLVAPAALALFGFLRGLDFLSLAIVYRAFDFMDYAVALLAGVGFAFVCSRLRAYRPAAAAFVTMFLAALIATTPMAWNSEAVFGVENVTTPAEFQALAVLAALHPASVTTDQRLADVGSWWFGLAADASLPLLLKDNRSVTGHDYALVLERWTTVGAQEHPAPNVVLGPQLLSAFLQTHRVVYVAGPLGDRIFVVQLSAA